MKKKILVACLCVALAVLTIAGTTLAYLTSKDTVTNTFTVGNVQIKLDEAKVDEMGKIDPTANARVQANTYKLIPGHTYTKDPTIHVDEKSENCFIRAKVTLNNADKWITIAANYADGKIENIIKGTDDNLWWVSNPAVDPTANTVTYTFVYKNKSKAESLKRVWQNGVDGKDLVLFNQIVIPGNLTGKELTDVANTTITVVAEAIQADGFAESSNDAAAAAEAYSKAMAALDAAK